MSRQGSLAKYRTQPGYARQAYARGWNARTTVQRAHTIGTLGPVSRQNFRVTKGFRAGTGWMGSRKRASLSQQSPFGSVSRQDGVKAGRPCVATRWRRTSQSPLSR